MLKRYDALPEGIYTYTAPGSTTPARVAIKLETWFQETRLWVHFERKGGTPVFPTRLSDFDITHFRPVTGGEAFVTPVPPARQNKTPMPTLGHMVALDEYRHELNEAIAKALQQDGGGKSYEGAVEIHLPGVHQDGFQMVVHCYILGPNRHYTYEGKTLGECVEKAKRDLANWKQG